MDLDKARETLEAMERVFQKDEQLIEQFMEMLRHKHDIEANRLAKKALVTLEVLRRHETALRNQAARDKVKLIVERQQEQLLDLDLLHRAILYLAKHPNAIAKVQAEIESEESKFILSLEEELKQLKK